VKTILTEDFIKKYKHVDFLLMSKKASCKRVSERLLSLHHLIRLESRKEAASIVGRHSEWLRMWILRYYNGGLENLYDRPKTGQPKYLTDEQEEQLVIDIMAIQDNRNGGRITGKEIGEHIKTKYNVQYKGTSIYDLLERIGMTWVSSRSKHPKADENEQKTFKQLFKARLAKKRAQKKSV